MPRASIRGRRVTVECQCCHRPYEALAHRGSRNKYCTLECYRVHRWGTKCPACGETPPRGKRFCREECERKHWDRRGGAKYIERMAHFAERKNAIMRHLGGACARCGNEDQRVLDVDHIDPSKKLRPPHRASPISTRVWLWEREMGNLQLLCANCHRLKTWEDRQAGRLTAERRYG